MTKLGKILVFVVLVLSIACSSWAAAVYSHSRGGAVKERKELANQLKDQYKAMQTERDRADGLRKVAADDLVRLEKQRDDNALWYKERLRILETGKNAQGQKVDSPVQGLRNDKGVIQLADNGLPKLQGAILDESTKQPLLDYETYLDQIKNDRIKLQQERDEVQKLIAKNQEISDQINGTKGKPPGLRDLLADERRKEREAREQQAYLDPLLFKGQVERQLLEKRLDQLEARLRELNAQAVGSTASRPPTGKIAIDSRRP